MLFASLCNEVSVKGVCSVLLEEQEFLSLKVPIMIAADNIHKYFFIVFQRK